MLHLRGFRLSHFQKGLEAVDRCGRSEGPLPTGAAADFRRLDRRLCGTNPPFDWRMRRSGLKCAAVIHSSPRNSRKFGSRGAIQCSDTAFAAYLKADLVSSKSAVFNASEG